MASPLANSALPLAVKILGVVDYAEVWALQKSIHTAVRDEGAPATLLLCGHPPVITSGTKRSLEGLLVSPQELKQRNIDLYQVERGGDLTFHSPSQLVIYPLLDLRRIRQDVGWYMRALEEVTILTLAEFGVVGSRIEGSTGVWVEYPAARPAKIASIGVKLSRWCSYHGVAIQVGPKHEGFALINPCGFTDIDITSASEVSGAELHPLALVNTFVNRFCDVFPYRNYSPLD